MKRLILPFAFLILVQNSFAQYGEWEGLPESVNDPVNLLIEYKNKLIVGGLFTEAGNIEAHSIASWDGTKWDSLGGGLNGTWNDFAYRAIIVDDTLYVVGSFEMAGSKRANYIAKWDGEFWYPVGEGTNDVIYSIAEFNGEIYVGGIFDSAGGVPARNIAKWNGKKWQPVGDGLICNNVNDIIVYKNQLYIVGVLDSVGDSPCSAFARLDGNKWNSLGNALEYGHTSMVEWHNKLIIGAEFHWKNQDFYQLVYQWDGNQLSVFSKQDMMSLYTLFVYEDKLFCSGGSGPTDPRWSNVQIWADSVWVPVGSGINDCADALGTYQGELYCGGNFHTGNDSPFEFIAKYNPSTSIPEKSYDNIDVTIFPIPFTNILNFRSNTSISNIKCTIMELSGKRIISKEFDNMPSNINVSTLSSGFYIIQIETKQKVVLRKKIIKI